MIQTFFFFSYLRLSMREKESPDSRERENIQGREGVRFREVVEKEEDSKADQVKESSSIQTNDDSSHLIWMREQSFVLFTVVFCAFNGVRIDQVSN